MKMRTLSVVVLVLAVLAALAYFLTRPAATSSADSRIGQPLVQPAVPEKAAKILIADQGKSVGLARQSDGSWHVTTYYDLPADFQKLTRFIGELTEAKLQRLVTTNPERLARLDFKDTKIEMLDGAGKELWSVTLGKSAETGGRFVRFGAEQKAYLANLSTWIDAEPKNWAEAQLLHFKPEEIAKVTVAPGDHPSTGGGVTAARAKKEDAWAAGSPPPGQQLKAGKVSSLLTTLSTLRFTETTEPDDPRIAVAKQHLRTYTLTTFDGTSLTISIGRQPEEKKLKPPAAAADGKSGPATLGSVTELAKSSATPPPAGSGDADKSEPSKLLAPEFETIPAGPAFVFISSSDPKAPINAMMSKRAFEVAEYAFTSLPQSAAEFFEPVPPNPPVPPATAPNANAPTGEKPAPAAGKP